MMNAPHKLDLSRLQHLEGLKRSFLAQSQASAERVKDLDNKIRDIKRQLAHAENALDEARRVSVQTVTEGPAAITSSWSNASPSAIKTWRAKVEAFQEQLDNVSKRQTDEAADGAAAFEKFNTTCHLIDRCNAFVAKAMEE